MSSGMKANRASHQGRSSIPVPSATHGTRPRGSPSTPASNHAGEPQMQKIYNDDDVVEYPLKEGESAPLFPVPEDEATNAQVKEYLLNVLTKTGWSIAGGYRREICATLNAYVGGGKKLRRDYQDNGLRNICPPHLESHDGMGVSDKTREDIQHCIVHEMGRFLGRGWDYQNGWGTGWHDNTRWADGWDDDSTRETNPPSNAYSLDTAEQRDVHQFTRSQQTRATLPEGWMSPSLRARTASRLSQHSGGAGAGAQKASRNSCTASSPLPRFISKTSAFPMDMDITTPPGQTRAPRRPKARPQSMHTRDPQASRPSSRPQSLCISERAPRTRAAAARRPRPLSSLNPYHTIPGSSIPRPSSSFAPRSMSRATLDADRERLRRVPSYECRMAEGLQAIIDTPVGGSSSEEEDSASGAAPGVPVGESHVPDVRARDFAVSNAAVQDAQRQDALVQDAQRRDAQRQDAQRQDAQRQDAQRQDAQMQDAQMQAAPMHDAQMKEAQIPTAPTGDERPTPTDTQGSPTDTQGSTPAANNVVSSDAPARTNSANGANGTTSHAKPRSSIANGTTKPCEDVLPTPPSPPPPPPPSAHPAPTSISSLETHAGTAPPFTPSPHLLQWRRSLPSTPTPCPMPTLPSSSGSGPEDSGGKVFLEGNVITVNDVPVGRDTITDAEEYAARKKAWEEATAARQEKALGRDRDARRKGRKRWWFKRVWLRMRGKGV